MTCGKRRVRKGLAVVTVLALGLVACGTGDEPGPESGSDESAEGSDDAALDVEEGGEVDEDVEPVRIGAIWPLSGIFEFNGSATLDGARAAVEDINAAGGIASLGGALVEMSEVDAGDSPEAASSAAERLLRDEPAAVAGAWLSSLSIAASEVTERAGVPFVSESFADEMTERGFQNVFVYAPPASQINDLLIDSARDSLSAAGVELERVALVGDNTAAATPLQDALRAQFAGEGIEVVVDDQWAPPLQDASGLAQRISRGDVDAVFMIAFGFNDVSTLVSQIRARGVDAPVIQNGGQALLPQWADVGDEVKGMASFVITHGLTSSEGVAADLAERLGVPYVWQDQLDGYFAIMLIAEALERAGSADPADVAAELRAMQLSDGLVVDLMPTDQVTFDDEGRIDPPFGVLVQWQEVDGELVPCTVFPEEYALCSPAW